MVSSGKFVRISRTFRSKPSPQDYRKIYGMTSVTNRMRGWWRSRSIRRLVHRRWVAEIPRNVGGKVRQRRGGSLRQRLKNVRKTAERCSEDGGVLRTAKIPTHGGWEIWYNTHQTPRWVDNRPLSFGNAVQGSDRKVWGPCLVLGYCNDEEAYDSLY